MAIIYTIDGMHCGSCVAKITEALKAISVSAVVMRHDPIWTSAHELFLPA